MALVAVGWATVSGSSMVLVRKAGGKPPTSLVGLRVRGLHSGATMAPATSAYHPPTSRYRVWLDYEQFRAFFVVSVEQLAIGEFGFAYDVTGANAYDVPDPFAVAFDGFPRLAADLYRQVYAAVDNVRAGGVGFELQLGDFTAELATEDGDALLTEGSDDIVTE